MVPKKRFLATGVTLLLGCLATVVAWHYARQVHLEREQARFENRVAESEAAIRARFVAYQQVLRAGVALFLSSDSVTREEWHRFVDSLETEQQYPGIQGIGFAARLDAASVAEHEALVRADGFPDYSVYPPLPPDGQGSAIMYLEPFDFRNQRAFGYDMYSHPVRREAMARARDSGAAALSGRVTLLQETEADRQAGTLLYLPLYRRHAPLHSLEQKREALLGWVYSPFRMKDLMQGILGDRLVDMQLDVYDGDAIDPQALLFRTPRPSPGFLPQFERSVSLEVGGRPWLLHVALEDPEPDTLSVLVLLGGSLLTLLLGALVASMGSNEYRATELALGMTAALRNSEERQRAIMDGTADAILSFDQRGVVQSFNSAAETMFGLDADEVIGRNVGMLMPRRFRHLHEDRLAAWAQAAPERSNLLRREVIGLRSNGDEFPVWLAVNRMPTPGGQPEFVGLASDISQRKRSERLLAQAHSLRRNILESAPFAILSTDEHGLIQSLNPAAERLIQYQFAELAGRETPVLLLDPEELQAYAAELSRRLGRPLEPGFASLTARARLGQTDEREWTWLRKDGERIPVQASTTALVGADGELEGFLIIAFDITERRNAQSYVEHLAHHDPLTNLPNRALLLDRLDQAVVQARRKREKVAVLLVDLDHFKRINDTLGHHVGDDLLLGVADRLSRAVRQIDTVSRLGGDEFVLILPGVSDRAAVRRIVGPLLDTLSAPFRVQGHEMTVTPSIGIALFPEHGEDARLLLKHADTAMYQAKEAGRRTYRFFEADMLKHNRRRLETENALRKALEKDEFSLAFQPQVEFDSGRIIGCEALLRWRNPRLGEVPPGSFVPMAEEMGLIQPIGEWVLRTACRQARQMQIALDLPLQLAVNISPRQFFQTDLTDIIQAALRESGLPAHCLEIEITEGVLVKNAEETIEMLRRIRRLGVQVSIDDFGTGYSSLSYLTCFPIDKLKIDKSFVRDITEDPNDAAVTSAIIVMAHTLSLKVVAEGVENQAQYSYLAERGCDIAQGYYFGRPLTQDLFIEAATRARPGLPAPAEAPDAVVRH